MKEGKGRGQKTLKCARGPGVVVARLGVSSGPTRPSWPHTAPTTTQGRWAKCAKHAEESNSNQTHVVEERQGQN